MYCPIVGTLGYVVSPDRKQTLMIHRNTRPHDHHLDKDGEGVAICQDDIVFMNSDGSCLGTEKGFFIKTDGLDEAGAGEH